MNFVAGIDAGAETVKIVILRDREIVYSNTVFAGYEAISDVAQKSLTQATKDIGTSVDNICLIGSTGVNANEVPFVHEEVLESICTPMGINEIFPEAHTLIDVGASKFVAMKCQEGRATKISRSDKCASSVGASLRMVASVLAMNIEDIGPLSLKSTDEVEIESTCSVFAETEIISLLHHYKKKPEDILMGVFRGMTARFYSLLLAVGIDNDIYMVGGVAKNEGIVKVLKDKTGHHVVVPPDPNIVGALGAALAVSNRDVIL